MIKLLTPNDLTAEDEFVFFDEGYCNADGLLEWVFERYEAVEVVVMSKVKHGKHGGKWEFKLGRLTDQSPKAEDVTLAPCGH